MASNLAHFVCQQRETLGISKAELARLSGLSGPQISNIELGNTKTLKPDKADQLAQALQVPLADLFRAMGAALPKNVLATRGALVELVAAARLNLATEEKLAALKAQKPAKYMALGNATAQYVAAVVNLLSDE
jgi:transcriptional regulator with XRE-family HTH domain